jgi:hypothetical protein
MNPCATVGLPAKHAKHTKDFRIGSRNVITRQVNGKDDARWYGIAVFRVFCVFSGKSIAGLRMKSCNIRPPFLIY